jgi:predicted ferric reductase
MKQSIFTAVSAAVTICFLAGLLVEAFPQYQSSIPNGDRVPNHAGVGHVAADGGGALNSFGVDFRNAGFTWSAAFCQRDSDGDGQSNGLELGDPACTWVAGSPAPRTTDISDPSLSSSRTSATATQTTTQAPPTTRVPTTVAPPTTTQAPTTVAPGATPNPPQPTPAPTPIPTTTTQAPPTPAPVPQYPRISPFTFLSPLNGLSSVNVSILRPVAAPTARRATAILGTDLLEVTLTLPTDRWIGFGRADTKMNGPLVACHVSPATGLATCLDLTGRGENVGLRSPRTTVVIASSQTASGAQVTFRTPLSSLPLTGGSDRIIFATGRWNSAVNYLIEHEDDGTDSRYINFYTGEVKPKSRNLDLLALGIGVIGTLLATIVGIVANCMKFVPTTNAKNFLWVLFILYFALLIIIVIVISHAGYSESGSGAPIGRAIGNGVAFLFFLILWPTTKHIGPIPLIGIPREKFLWPHMLTGFLILVLMTTHFGIMWEHFATLGGSQQAAVDTVLQWNETGKINVAGFIAWLLLILMLIPAMFFRNAFYTFFKATHLLFFWIILIFAAIHHTPVWVLIAPSFLALVVDYILQIRSGSVAHTALVGATYHSSADIIELRVQGALSLAPAQFGYIGLSGAPGMPHPFSIAGYDDGIMSFFIRPQGEGSWTRKVANLLSTNVNVGTVRFMGPYGKLEIPLEFPSHFLLVSGGVGVTPMISILQCLSNPHFTPQGVRSIKFIWVVRSVEIVAVIAPAIEKQLAKFPPTPAIDVQAFVHITQPSSPARELPVLPRLKIIQGRPSFASYFSSYNGAEKAAVYLCGPQAMMTAASTEAGKHGLYVHTETFSV